jgi:hypothetical protein
MCDSLGHRNYSPFNHNTNNMNRNHYVSFLLHVQNAIFFVLLIPLTDIYINYHIPFWKFSILSSHTNDYEKRFAWKSLCTSSMKTYNKGDDE